MGYDEVQRKAEPPVRVPRATLPDLRQEQFFLTTIRRHVEVHDTQDDALILESESKTPWQGITNIAWLPLVYTLFMEQFISPIWQGMLWGLGGVTLTHFRQLYAIGRARNMRSPTAQAATIAKEAEKTAPMRETIGAWIARLGLTRLFV
ncbi:hypothetical protein MYAM1_002401 [Malassezia yamatoensis]|uniref:Uncharacterized protein n=1 Tax=Malassezia yamatoensis TaxID=253288 RepID=A0AAJ6CJ95_9BASI|nr:hypothetical protein MYAM1_002401 [Malassezia yamatoensis]